MIASYEQTLGEALHEQLMVWKCHATKVLKNTRGLSDEQSTAFVSLTIQEDEMLKDYSFLSTVSSDKSYQLIQGRAEQIGLLLNPVVATFIAGYLVNNPAEVVMYVSYIRLHQKHIKKVNMEQLADLFADGFFSEKDLQELWHLQKISSEHRKELRETYLGHSVTDNLLDILDLLIQ
jgi:hypothetical protein